jgi:lysophospholipase L1-like esterase
VSQTVPSSTPSASPASDASVATALDAGTALGLRKLAAIAATFALLGVATYALPGTQRLRPWVPGEGMPVARMFADNEAELPEFAEAAVQSNESASRTQVGDRLGAQVMQNLGEDPDGDPGGDSGAPGAAGPANGPRERVLASEYEGITQHIEHPEALQAFLTKLGAAARGQAGAIARVAHYGDSAVAADAITSTARRRLQQRFGDSGHGFVLIARGSMHYGHKDVVQRSSGGWEVNSIVNLGLRPGLYGYGGVMARGGGGERAYFGTVADGKLGTRVSSFELFYQKARGSGSLELKVDGERKGVIEARASKTEDAFHRIEVPDGPHQLAIKALGPPSRLYGVALERDAPGVVYDSLGIVGAVAERLLGAEPEHIAAQIAHRDPDMLVLAFGGNESANAWLNIEQYERDLTKVVEHMRRGKPKMSCLLFGPLDQGDRDKRGKVVTVKVLPKIVGAQRRVAERQGCAFFDAFAAMGGEGAMGKWIKVRPKLATSDLRHATPAGYEVIGNMYYKALLEAFAAQATRAGK